MNAPAFLLLAIGLSWACWLPLAAADGTSPLPLIQLGSLGPLLAAVLLLARPGNAAGRGAFARDFAAIRRLASPTGAMAVALAVGIALLGRMTFAMSGGLVLPPPGAAELLPILATVLLLGVLPEEAGWRGYALPALSRRLDPVTAALVLGTAWAVWELPLYWVQGSYQSGIEAGSAEHLLHALNIAAESVVLCALVRITGTIWAAIAFRGTSVLLGELWQLPADAEAHRHLWTLAVALAVLARPEAFGLDGRPRPPGR